MSLTQATPAAKPKPILPGWKLLRTTGFYSLVEQDETFHVLGSESDGYPEYFSSTEYRKAEEFYIRINCRDMDERARATAPPPTVRPEHITQRLLQLPDEIEEAESQVLAAEDERRLAQASLDTIEARVVLDPERVNGKNAEQRQAQVLLLTEEERNLLAAATMRVEEAKVHLRHLQNEFSAVRSLVRWLTPEETR